MIVDIIGGFIILSILAHFVISILKEQRALTAAFNNTYESIDKSETLSLQEANDELREAKTQIKDLERYLNSWDFLPDAKKEHVADYLEIVKLYRTRLELRIEELQ